MASHSRRSFVAEELFLISKNSVGLARIVRLPVFIFKVRDKDKNVSKVVHSIDLSMKFFLTEKFCNTLKTFPLDTLS